MLKTEQSNMTSKNSEYNWKIQRLMQDSKIRQIIKICIFVKIMRFRKITIEPRATLRT